jgi:uncharacterized membrane protein YphA (DoxX/SURF4 family)
MTIGYEKLSTRYTWVLSLETLIQWLMMGLFTSYFELMLFVTVLVANIIVVNLSRLTEYRCVHDLICFVGTDILIS